MRRNLVLLTLLFAATTAATAPATKPQPAKPTGPGRDIALPAPVPAKLKPAPPPAATPATPLPPAPPTLDSLWYKGVIKKLADPAW